MQVNIETPNTANVLKLFTKYTSSKSASLNSQPSQQTTKQLLYDTSNKMKQSAKCSLLPSATGQYTWRETHERKAAHEQVGVHQNRTCRQHTESVHRSPTVD